MDGNPHEEIARMCGHVDPETARAAQALRQDWLRGWLAAGLERLRGRRVRPVAARPRRRLPLGGLRLG